MADVHVLAIVGRDINLAAFVERLGHADRSAEAELVERYRPLLLALLRHRVHDAARAEDLCQETLLVALENLRAGSLRDPSCLWAYLRGIAANLSRRGYRGAWRQTSLELIADPVDPSDGPQEALAAVERARLIRLALMALSARDRAVLAGFYIDGHEKRAVCQDLGLSQAQFDVIKFRALRRLARLWDVRSVTQGRLSNDHVATTSASRC